MPFPTRGSAPAAPSAPGFGAPAAPAAPPFGAPAAPAAPLAPPAQAAEPQFYVSQNGQAPVLVSVSQARSLPPATMAITQDQSSGWIPLSQMLAQMAPAAAVHAPTQPPPRGAFAAAQPQQQQQMSSVPRGVFAGVGAAQVSRQGAYTEEGDYIVKVVEAQHKNTAQFSGVIIEVEILTSSFVEGDPVKSKCNREGSRMTVFVKQNQSFASNMKEIILAVSGFDAQGKPRPEDSQVSEDECLALVSASQPFAGVLCYLEARQKPTQAGGKFTRVSWWPCPLLPDGTPDTGRLFTEIR